MSPFLEKTLTPADLYYSRNPAVAQIMRSMREEIGNDIVGSARNITCNKVNDLLPKYPTVYERVNLLRDIARKNNDFIDNWRTGELPPIFLSGAFLRILHDKTITEDDFYRIGSIVEIGLNRDHHCVDDGVAALLCGRKFPPDMRERMFQKLLGIAQTPAKQAPNRAPNKFVITHKVLGAYFSRTREEDSIVGVPITNIMNVMEWAIREYENRPNILSDTMLSTYILREDLPYEKVLTLMDFIRHNSRPRKYNQRDHKIGGLKIYNAFYTRALNEPGIEPPDISKIPKSVIDNADQSDLDYYLYLEGLIISRNRHSS